MNRLLATIALSACASCVAVAQSAAPEFEVASVKPSNGGQRGIWNSPERLSILNMTLKSILIEAYAVKDNNIFGPAWIDADRFEITAKMSPDIAKLPEGERWKQIHAMMQTLLADRFKLQVHRETREMPVYALLPAKGGVKLIRSGPPSDYWVHTVGGHGSLTAKQIPMDQLLSILGGSLHREVLDESGIDGVFDIKLDWAPDETKASDKPSLFTALQEQAGLRLEARKAPREVVVVDRAERPSEN
jgi:uncharacterized protein (TIGR03435 family)